MGGVADERITFNLTASTSAFSYWATGPGSQPITWLYEQPEETDSEIVARRVEALRNGCTQWGHDGAHHGTSGDPTCPSFLHHHHDDRCALPTRRECEMAGVEYRTRWGSRA